MTWVMIRVAKMGLKTLFFLKKRQAVPVPFSAVPVPIAYWSFFHKWYRYRLERYRYRCPIFFFFYIYTYIFRVGNSSADI